MLKLLAIYESHFLFWKVLQPPEVLYNPFLNKSQSYCKLLIALFLPSEHNDSGIWYTKVPMK